MVKVEKPKAPKDKKEEVKKEDEEETGPNFNEMIKDLSNFEGRHLVKYLN